MVFSFSLSSVQDLFSLQTNCSENKKWMPSLATVKASAFKVGSFVMPIVRSLIPAPIKAAASFAWISFKYAQLKNLKASLIAAIDALFFMQMYCINQLLKLMYPQAYQTANSNMRYNRLNGS